MAYPLRNTVNISDDPYQASAEATTPTVPTSTGTRQPTPQAIHGPLTSPTVEQGFSQFAALSLSEDSFRNHGANTAPLPSPRLSPPPRGVFNRLMQFSELTFEVAKHFDIEDLISLYAISKDFHLLANRHLTGLMLSQSVAKAAESSRTFIHRCYKNLCLRDPAARRLSAGKNEGEIRWVPSFRWLRMILFREAVVDSIIRSLLYEGHRLPKRASLALKKLWFTLDMSDNHRRIGIFHNEVFWTSTDLFTIQTFIIKLDLRLTDPVTGNGEIGLRRLLLDQRSLSTLARVLRREEMKTQLDLMRMIVRYDYTPPRPLTGSILGVPAQEVGKLQYEGWGIGGSKLIPIDQMVVGESVRRQLDFEAYYIDMMLYGFIDKRTGADLWAPERPVERNTEREDSSTDDRDTGWRDDTAANAGARTQVEGNAG